MTKPWSLGRLHRARAGTAAMEFALVALPLLAIIFGIMQFGMVLWTKASLQSAVEAAARCASVNTTVCGTDAQIQQYAANRMGSVVIPQDFTPSSTACGLNVPGKKVSATIPYNVGGMAWLPASITLTAWSCHPV